MLFAGEHAGRGRCCGPLLPFPPATDPGERNPRRSNEIAAGRASHRRHASAPVRVVGRQPGISRGPVFAHISAYSSQLTMPPGSMGCHREDGRQVVHGLCPTWGKL